MVDNKLSVLLDGPFTYGKVQAFVDNAVKAERERVLAAVSALLEGQRVFDVHVPADEMCDEKPAVLVEDVYALLEKLGGES